MKKWLAAGAVVIVALAVALPLLLMGGGGGSGESTFALTMLSPTDESVVTGTETTVSGTTSPDAVVSVNGYLVEVDLDGNFSTVISLEEGPNSIEVVASDYEGNETGQVVTVICVA